MMEEIDLRIDKTGRVIIHVTGPEGKEKTQRIRMVADMVGRLDENYKSPHPHPKVGITRDMRSRIQQGHK